MLKYTIEQIMVGDNYTYLVINGNEAVVIDPSKAAPVLNVLEGRNLRCNFILNTHEHWDHTAGNEELKERTSCKIVGPHLSIPAVDILAGEDLEPGGCIPGLQVLSVPGHTPSSVAYYIPSIHAVFTGDTLFAAGCGRLLGCPPGVMYRSLMRLASLPGQTKVYCGHEYTLDNLRFASTMEPGNEAVQVRLREVESLYQRGMTTMPSLIDIEKKTNPFLRVHSPDIIRTINANGRSPEEVFAELRRRKDLFQT